MISYFAIVDYVVITVVESCEKLDDDITQEYYIDYCVKYIHTDTFTPVKGHTPRSHNGGNENEPI